MTTYLGPAALAGLECTAIQRWEEKESEMILGLVEETLQKALPWINWVFTRYLFILRIAI